MTPIFDFIKNIGKKNGLQQKEHHRTILSVDVFLSVIRRETSRYNRNQRPFSVISLDLGASQTTAKKIDKITKKLSSRIRISDDIGWLDNNILGILLSETNRDGTEALIQSLFDNSDHFSKMVMTVYYYPSPAWPDKFL